VTWHGGLPKVLKTRQGSQHNVRGVTFFRGGECAKSSCKTALVFWETSCITHRSGRSRLFPVRLSLRGFK
jgi:hypothetical protein